MNKKLLTKYIQNIINEEYKGTIGSPIEKEYNPTLGRTEYKRGKEAKPIVFDSEEENRLTQSTRNERIRTVFADDKQYLKQIGPVSKASVSKQKKTGARIFSGKKFKRDAKWMLGEKAFPDRGVYIIPIMGGKKEAAKLMFNYEVPSNLTRGTSEWDKHEARYSAQVADFDNQRHLIYDISAEGINILANLGVSIGEMKNIDAENDTIFIPISSTTAANFKASPHMIVHALLDTRSHGIDAQRTVIDKAVVEINSTMRRYCRENDIDPLMLRGNPRFPESEKLAKTIRKLGTTKAFRDNTLFTAKDFVTEILTQEITRSRPPSKVDIDLRAGDYPKNNAAFTWNGYYMVRLPSLNDQLFFFKLGKSVVKTANKIREVLKGKIVITNHA